MQINEANFGIFVSTVLPGFIVILGLGHHFEIVKVWLGNDLSNAPTVGGFLFLTVASVFSGLSISTIRWLVIDTIHARTGLRQPDWDFSLLGEREEAFKTLISIHYRYYQFYANSIVAILLMMPLRWFGAGFSFGWRSAVCIT